MTFLEFFESLDEWVQLIILECAYQALSDELMDGFMREGHMLEDVSEDELTRVYQTLGEYMERAS